MEDNSKPIQPIIPEIKQPTFEDPLKMVDNDIKLKTGTIPPVQGGSSVSTNSSPLESAVSKANEVNSGFSFKNFDVKFDDAFTQLNSGDSVRKFESFEKDRNNEDRLAKLQTTGEKWANGLQKFGIKTGTAVLGGTIGTVEGIINGVSQGSWDAVYNSDFNNWLDDVNTSVDYSLPNYYTEQEKQKGLGSSALTANFWANDVLGGLSFTVGTIVSEGIWAAATGGTSVIARGANLTGRIANWSSKSLGTVKSLKGLQKAAKTIKQPYINASKTKQILDQARFLTTSAGYESGFEARHYMKETEQEWQANFELENGRLPNAFEKGEFKEGLTESANAVFATNMALVGFSNQVVLGKMILGKTTTGAVKNSAIKRKLFGLGFDKTESGAIKALTPNKYQKVAGRLYGFAKPAITEGVIEEGGQAVTSGTAKNYMLSAYSPEGTNESISLTEALYDSMAETYGTKQGFKEVGIGMIIGILGGGASSGFKFNDVAQERAFLENRINYRNQFTANNIMDRIKANNKIFEANKRGEAAKVKGDLTGELMSERDVMIASIERDYHFEGSAEGIETFSTAIQGIDTVELAEQLGVDEKIAQDWKNEKVQKYTDLSNSYAKNKVFAQSIMGTGEIAGLKNPAAKAEIEKAIAYNLTMATEVDSMADDYVANIKEEIGSTLTDSDILDSLDVDNLLRKVDDKTELDYQKTRLQQEVLLKKREQLEKSLREVQNKVTTPENKVQTTEKLGTIQESLIEINEEIDAISQKKELLINTMELQFPESNEIITEEMLDNQRDRAERLGSLIEGLRESNPEKYGRIHKLLQEYQRATKVTKEFQNTTKAILDPKLRVTEINGWLDSLLKKGKGLDEFSEKFFTDVLNNYGKDTAAALEDNIAAQASLNSSEGVDEGVSEGVDDITPPAPENNVPTQREVITNMINDISSNNKYLVDYFGQDEKEMLKSRPSKKDVDKYRELLGKIQSSNKNEVLLAEENPKDSGLTEEEFNELKDVNEKLADWKLLEGAVNNEGDSITGLIELLDQLDNMEVKDNTKTEIDNRDFIKINESVEKQKAQRATAAALQTPDVAMVSLKDDELTDQEVYQFSHLKIGTFPKLFPGSTLYFIDSKGVKKNYDSADKNTQDRVSSTVGTNFVLETPQGVLPISLKERKRLQIPAIAMNEMLPQSNIKILNFGLSKFLSVYEKLSDTEFIPLQGDFNYESTQKNEVIKIDSNAIANLKSGDILRTEINLNDTYNAALLKQYKKDGDKKALESKLQVYVTTQKGQLVGSFAAMSDNLPNTPATDKLIQVRSRAVNLALAEGAKGKIDLRTTVQVSTVLTGAPKLNLEEQADGSLLPKDMDFTLDSINQVQAVGFSRGGEIKLDKAQDNSKINTIFVDNLTEANTNEIIPVIVFEANNQKIAYPISLKVTEVDKSIDIINVLNTNLPSGQKLSKMYGILAENGIDPSNFSVDISQPNWGRF